MRRTRGRHKQFVTDHFARLSARHLHRKHSLRTPPRDGSDAGVCQNADAMIGDQSLLQDGGSVEVIAGVFAGRIR
ncbi:MAG UNVERIFIED_CONTAM: hypothetical protein LVR18_33285 [Planctomycetaceae bacterium]